MDQDYLKKLSPEELTWLNKFMGEYYGAALDYKDLKKNLHKTKKLKKECTDRNNRQNNDLYGVTRSVGLVDSIDGYEDVQTQTNNQLLEIVLSEKIDRQKLK